MVKSLVKAFFCIIFVCGLHADNSDRHSYIEQLEFFNDSITEMRDVLALLDHDCVNGATLKLRYYLHLKQIKRIDLQIKDRQTLRDLPDTSEEKRREIKKQLMQLIATKKNLLQRCTNLVREIKKQAELVYDQKEN